MSETSKAHERRLREGWFEKYIREPGIYIGCGRDKGRRHVDVIRGGDKPQPARGGRSVLRPAEACPVVKPPNRTASCSTQSFLL
jgi:hypothetical protein